MPYNLGFETDYFGSPIGWELSKKSQENGFVIATDTLSAFSGRQCLTLKHKNNKEKNIATFSQRIDAAIYRNRKVRFSAWAKVEKGFNGPILFLESTTLDMKKCSNIKECGILSNNWTNFIVELDIPQNAKDITYGIIYDGKGTIFLDACEFDFVRNNDSLYYEKPKKLNEFEFSYLKTFAKSYGYVKYFCANKEVINADWNTLALAGINLGKSISNLDEIASSLNNFYSGIASQVLISKNPKELACPLKQDYKYALAQVYRGVPTNITKNYVTKTQTVNLNSSLKNKDGVVVQYINHLSSLRGKEIGLSINVKLKHITKYSKAHIALRFENEKGDFIDYKQSSDITSRKWKKYNITHIIPEEATRASIILSFNGYGEAYFDNVQLYVKKDKKYASKLSVKNSGFEKYLSFNGKNWLIANETIQGEYEVNYSEKEKYKGKMSLLIYSDPKSKPKCPKKNDIIKGNISDNLIISFPATVGAELEKIKINDSLQLTDITYPKPSNYKFVTGKNEQFNLSWKDRASRLVMVIKTWNLLKHFSLTKISEQKLEIALETALETALKEAATCSTKEDFLKILSNLLDVSDDIRARAWFTSDNSMDYSLPFLMELINNKLYIASGNLEYHKMKLEDFTNGEIEFGDEILAIDGKNIKDEFAKKKNSEKWKKIRLATLFRLGKKNSEVKLKIKNSKGKIINKTMKRKLIANMLSTRQMPAMTVLDTNIVYINFSAVDDRYLMLYLDSLQKYDKFIFDLRGNIRVSEAFLSLLMQKPFSSSQTCIPFFAKPNKELMTYYKQSGVYAPAMSKRLNGKYIFLTDRTSSGKSELFASVVKNTKVGKLLGQKTESGLLTSMSIRLDADFTISLGTAYGFTPKGKPLYKVGVSPDIPVKISIEDIKNNRDAILEAAIKKLNKTKK